MNPKEELINILLSLYSDEWLAVYQYSIESDFCLMMLSQKAISQKVYNQITKELDIHTTEEFQHAKLLVPELIRMGSGPISHPNLLVSNAGTHFRIPSKNHIVTLEQALESEQDAIDAYQKAIVFVENHFSNDTRLLETFIYILNQELEHKDDLQKILKEITY